MPPPLGRPPAPSPGMDTRAHSMRHMAGICLSCRPLPRTNGHGRGLGQYDQGVQRFKMCQNFNYCKGRPQRQGGERSADRCCIYPPLG